MKPIWLKRTQLGCSSGAAGVSKMKTVLFWILVVGAAFANGSPAVATQDKSANEVEKSVEDLQIDSFVKCTYKEGFTGLLNCAATRALKILQQADKTESFELLPGVALTSDTPLTIREGKAIAEQQLPADPKQKMEKLLNMVVDATSRFLSGRTLRIKIPEISVASIARALEEGRAKKKKKGGMSPLFLILGAKALLLKALSILGLGFMAVKALLLSKIAFVLAVILAAQSLFGGAGGLGNFNLKGLGGGTPYFGGHGWISGGGSGSSGGSGGAYGPPQSPGWTTNSIGGWSNSQYPYARSIDNVSETEEETRKEANALAYSQQKP